MRAPFLLIFDLLSKNAAMLQLRHGSITELSLFDITNEVYKEATDVKTKVIDGKTYISGLTLSMESSSSKDIRFYKVDVNNNYTYPNGNTQPIITITSK